MMVVTEDASLHVMQRAFRRVLSAFAHPGRVFPFDPLDARTQAPAALDSALETIVRMFVDQAVTFGVNDAERDGVERYLASETHARRVETSRADFVIVPARADARLAFEAVREASAGDLLAPEKGATVIVGCTRLLKDPADQGAAGMHVVAVRGPGVKDVNRFAVDRVAWAEARAARGDEYPCGIEIVLVDGTGNVVAVPRSSHILIEGGR